MKKRILITSRANSIETYKNPPVVKFAKGDLNLQLIINLDDRLKKTIEYFGKVTIL